MWPRGETPDTDVVTQITGNFGRWQLRSILLIFLCHLPSAWFMMCIIYNAPTRQKGELYCNLTATTLNGSSDMEAVDCWRVSYPVEDMRQTDHCFRIDVCNIYEEKLERKFAARYFNNSTFCWHRNVTTSSEAISVMSCDHDADNRSLLTNYNWTCSQQLIISVSQSFHALGALIGGLFSIKALKHVSPRRLMLYSMLGQTVCGTLTGLVHTYQLHVYFRCLTSLFCALMYSAGQVILADITIGLATTIVITLFELFSCIGLMLLPGMSLIFDSWTSLYIAISSSLIILAFLHRWITDSPRWLLQHKQHDKALEVLLQSATYNNGEIPLNLEIELKIYARYLLTERSASYWSIWDGRNDRKCVVSVHVSWIGTIVLYNIMILLIRSLGLEHLYVNSFSLGLTELVGVLMGLCLILFTRQYWHWTGYMLIFTGLLCSLIWLIPPTTIQEKRYVGLEIIFWIAIKLANSVALAVLTACTGELVDSKKRRMLMLSLITCGRVWLVFATFITTLYLLHPLVSVTIFASLTVLTGVSMCFTNQYLCKLKQPAEQIGITLSFFRRGSTVALLRQTSTSFELNAIHGSQDNPLEIRTEEL